MSFQSETKIEPDLGLMQNILVIQQTDLGEPWKTIVNMMGAGRKWPHNNNTFIPFFKKNNIPNIDKPQLAVLS